MKKMRNALGVEITIASGAVNAYKNLGFVEVEDKVKKDETPIENEQQEKTEDEKFLDYVVSKPITEWTKQEMSRFAKINKITHLLKDENGERKPTEEIREIIVNYINTNE